MGKSAAKYLLKTFWIVVTLILTALALSGLAAGYAPLQNSSTLFSINLALPVLVPLCLLMSLYWAFKRSWWFCVALIGVVANFNYVLSMVQFSTPYQPMGSELSLASYNVCGFRNHGVKITSESIGYESRMEGVNVMCIQEFNVAHDYGVDSIKSAFFDLPYSYIPTSGDNYSLAIFSMFEIVDKGAFYFDDTNNGIIWADIDFYGTKVKIINAHLQSTGFNQTGSDRNILSRSFSISDKVYAADRLQNNFKSNLDKRYQQLDTLRQLIDGTEGPLLVCGDFNSIPASYVYNTVKKGLKDTFRICGNGYGSTYRGFMSLLRIDYILCNDSFNQLSCRVPDWSFSDHKPVMFISEVLNE